MHFGFEPGALLADADLVIALESDVPWIPSLQQPHAGCRVAHVGEEPFYVRYPMRSFPSDLALQAGPLNALEALTEAVEARLQMAEARIAARRARLTERMRMRRAQLAKDFARRRDHLAGISVARDRRSGRAGRDHRQRISAAAGPLRAREAGHFLRARPGRRARLGLRRGARRQARRARRLRGRDARRRRLHVLQSDGRALGRRHARAADPHHRFQQQPLRRRAPRHAVDVQGRRRRRERRPRPRRSRPLAGLTRRWRKRKAPMPSAWKSRPTCRTRSCARAKPSSTGAARRCSTSLRPTESVGLPNKKHRLRRSLHARRCLYPFHPGKVFQEDR